MFEQWLANIRANRQIVRENRGPSLVSVVSGDETSQRFWDGRFAQTRADVFRSDGSTDVVSVCEETRKGNFLGTLRAWKRTKAALAERPTSLPPIALMSMVFGQGKRLSPFTQASGNRKPAFLLPLRGEKSDSYLCAAEMSNLYANLWIDHLAAAGFRGVLVKWGDEAIVPGLDWRRLRPDLSNVDAVRFVWKTEITPDLAREKDWVAIDAASGRMSFQYSRQPVESLKKRLAELPPGSYELGVNLGSLAVTYDFLDSAVEVFADDLEDPGKWADWDPFAWIALACGTEQQWRREAELEDGLGKRGIREVEERIPDFYAKIARLREAHRQRTGRPLSVAVLDFGPAFWTDIGLHLTLRKCLESLTEETDRGRAYRALFRVPDARDANGNIVIRSELPAGLELRGSVVIDTSIADTGGTVQGGLLVGCRLGRVEMPHGGSALFCAAGRMAFEGPRGVAYRSVDREIVLPEGGRHTTLFLPGRTEQMVTNESVLDYRGDNYSKPIMGNAFSFEEAGRLMSQVPGAELDAAWREAWQREV